MSTGTSSGRGESGARRKSWIARLLHDRDSSGFRAGVCLAVFRVHVGEGARLEECVGGILSDDLPRAAELISRKWRGGTYRIRELGERGRTVAMATLRIPPDAASLTTPSPVA